VSAEVRYAVAPFPHPPRLESLGFEERR